MWQGPDHSQILRQVVVEVDKGVPHRDFLWLHWQL
jgi:hypothetical protein